ncbi:zinc finger protein 70-like [Cylas formicarius]|uniref:zinc finger protein 70-like n=1 Tax=Cylas formicarius TaxID=197179 RepID=UPI00295835B4|nr:zinc finger protein 70-like [Cylas formicarius]
MNDPALELASRTCRECGKVFSDVRSYKNHVRDDHKGLHQCEYCGKMFAQIYGHLSAAHRRTYKFECELCDRGFLYEGALHHHVQSVHEQARQVCACAEKHCGKVFTSNQSLKDHHKKHEGVEYSCEQCPKMFNHPSSFKRHLKDHRDKLNKRVVPCDVCDKKVCSLKSLREHMLIHSGDMPFVCEHCGRRFRLRKNLMTHSVVHTKERPFPCNVCGVSFTQRGSMKRHFLKAHPDQKL